MPGAMHNRGEPWKWPVSIGLALSLTLAVVFWLPRSWLGFLLSPRAPSARIDRHWNQRWLILVPPPRVEVVTEASEPLPPERLPTRPLHQDPRWWSEGWVVGAAEDAALFAPTVPATNDTLRLILAELGLGVDVMTRARPDSLLAARLLLLRLEDSLRFDVLKPTLAHLGRAEAYADIMSRAADMYDEPLQQEIRVPD